MKPSTFASACSNLSMMIFVFLFLCVFLYSFLFKVMVVMDLLLSVLFSEEFLFFYSQTVQKNAVVVRVGRRFFQILSQSKDW